MAWLREGGGASRLVKSQRPTLYLTAHTFLHEYGQTGQLFPVEAVALCDQHGALPMALLHSGNWFGGPDRCDYVPLVQGNGFKAQIKHDEAPPRAGATGFWYVSSIDQSKRDVNGT